MRKSIVLLMGMFVLMLAAWPAFAGSEDDARVHWTKRYEQAQLDLQFGGLAEKLNAIRLMGAHKKHQYIRPLGRELLNHMVNQKFLKLPTNDPYVKSQIAWALGEIGHKQAIGDLLQALEISLELAKSENEERNKQRDILQKQEDSLRRSELELLAKNRQSIGAPAQDENEDKYKITIPLMGYDRPGPLLDPGYAFPNSADMYWSIADEFKGSSYDYKYMEQRVRMEHGANWLNLARSIFSALGKIGHESAVEPVKKYLESEYPIVRGYAAQSLGAIAKSDKSAMLAVKEKYTAEKSERVQTYMAWAILSNSKSEYPYYLDLLGFLKSNDVRTRYDAIRVLDSLGMGESEHDLREALKVEGNGMLRAMLVKAIHNAQMNNIMPVNY